MAQEHLKETNFGQTHASESDREIQRLEAEIQRTREEMDERLAELRSRMSPKNFFRRKVMDTAGRKVRDMRSGISTKASHTVDSVRHFARDNYEKGKHVAAENYSSSPLIGCGIAFGAGLMLGSLAPASAAERRVLSPSASKLKHQIDEKAAHVIEAGRERLEEDTTRLETGNDESSGLTGTSGPQGFSGVDQDERDVIPVERV